MHSAQQWYQRSLEQWKKGKAKGALKALAHAIELSPQELSYRHHYAVMLHQSGRSDEAFASLRFLLQQVPSLKEPLLFFVTLCRQKGMLAQAEEALLKAIAHDPNQASLYQKLGILYADQGRFEQGLFHFKKALELDPQNASLFTNCGKLLLMLNRSEQAITAFRHALELDPQSYGAQMQLGQTYMHTKQFQEAYATYKQCLSTHREDPSIHNALGAMDYRSNRFSEAEDHFKKAIALDPKHSLHLAYDNYLSTIISNPKHSPQYIFEQHYSWGKLVESTISLKGKKRTFSPKNKIHIGYFSPDFREHSIAYFMRPLLRYHNQEEFEITCYFHHNHQDSVTEECRHLSQNWRVTYGMSETAIAAQIQKDAVDILIDLAGHSCGNQLSIFAQKPAPLQISYLGYPATTGLTRIDYRLCDSTVDPQENQRYYTETLLSLPHCFLCYEPASIPPPLRKKRKEGITYASFNNSTKLNEVVLKTWACILHQVPQSSLLLKSQWLEATELREWVCRHFEEEGIERKRIEFLKYARSHNEHLQYYNDVDIALDPFPYNGTTTSFEALFMGVPVLTLQGEAHISRVGTSILSHLGKEEWIAHTTEEYVQKAVELASVSTERKALSDLLLHSSLCDAPRFVQNLESCYRKIFSTQNHSTN